MRCVLGAARRKGNPVVRDSGRSGRWQDDHDARGAAGSDGSDARRDSGSAEAPSPPAGVDRPPGPPLRLLPERNADPGRRPPGHDQATDGRADQHGDERSSVPLRHLSADREGDPGRSGGHEQGSEIMSEPLSKDPPLAHALHGRELSRPTFLRGGGALVIGLTAAGTAAASDNPTAVSAGHTGAVPGPPDPAQIDSWLQVNPDNTVTLFHGWTEMGQGSPTAVRQIAAEELGLSMAQVSSVRLDTNVSISSFAAASSSTRTAMAATSMRGAAAAARTLLVNQAATQLGVPA